MKARLRTMQIPHCLPHSEEPPDEWSFFHPKKRIKLYSLEEIGRWNFKFSCGWRYWTENGELDIICILDSEVSQPFSFIHVPEYSPSSSKGETGDYFYPRKSDWHKRKCQNIYIYILFSPTRPQ